MRHPPLRPLRPRVEAAGVQGLHGVVVAALCLAFVPELSAWLWLVVPLCGGVGVIAFLQWHGPAPSGWVGVRRAVGTRASVWGLLGLWWVVGMAVPSSMARPHHPPLGTVVIEALRSAPIAVIFLWWLVLPSLLYALLSGALLGAWQARRGEVSGADEAPGR